MDNILRMGTNFLGMKRRMPAGSNFMTNAVLTRRHLPFTCTGEGMMETKWPQGKQQDRKSSKGGLVLIAPHK